MNLEFPIYSVIFFITSLLTLGLGIVARRRKMLSGSAPFALLMLAVAVWMTARAVEGATLSMAGKIAWAKIEYLGIPWIGILWLGFLMRYLRKDRLLTRRNLVLACIIPAVTMLLAFTNEIHHLIWTTIQVSPVNNGILIYKHGQWFWLAAIYNYLGIISGMVLMLPRLSAEPRSMRKQAIALFIGALFPIGANLVYLAGLSPVKGLDITPFGFVISGVIFSWVVFGMNLFLLVPLARERLVDNLPEGVVVLDPDNLVADINPSALHLLKIDKSPIGKNIAEFTHALPELNIIRAGNLQIQLDLQPGRTFELQVTPLTNSIPPIGRLVVIHDITSQKQAEAVQVKARKRAEALNEITHSIYHKLEINELMELVYEQVNRFIEAHFFLIATYDRETDEWESVFLKEPINAFPKKRYKSSEGITGYVIQTREPLLLNNTVELDAFIEWSGRRNLALKPKSMMIVPLNSFDGVVGAMGTQNYDQEDYYTNDDFFFFSTLGIQIAAAFENARSYAHMEQLATTDPLTGLYNRRYLFSLAQIELDQALRYQHPLSAIMMDIDHFKQVNDTFGHAAGDQVMIGIADLCRKSFRKVDTVGRYGGEEFLIILPETSAASALIAADRLRSRISQADIATQDARIQVTVSMGVASLETAQTLDSLVEQADKALYAAKQAGRNLTRVYPDL